MVTHVSTRGPVLLGLVMIGVLLGGFGLWSGLARISGAVVAAGQVEVDQKRQVVQHPDGGVVAGIFVRDGDPVRSGQPLIRLNGDMLRSELSVVEGQYFELLARRGRLEAERSGAAAPIFPLELQRVAGQRPDVATLMDGQARLFTARADTVARSLDQLGRRLDQTRSQIGGIEAQIAALGTQKHLIAQELRDQRGLLAKGLAQAGRVLALERETAALAGRLGELSALRAQAEGRLAEIELERLRLASARREEAEAALREDSDRELELAERRRILQARIAALDIRAPVGGVVHAMAVTTPGAVIRAAEPLLFVVPQDRPLVITAQIPTVHIDELHIGQPTTLRLSAVAGHNAPELSGHVARISADALMDEGTRMPFYRAEIIPAPDALSGLGDLTLVPGMPVDVFIQTGSRAPLSYLLSPFTNFFVRAFRES